MKLSLLPLLSLIVWCAALALPMVRGLECETLKFEVGHIRTKVSSSLLKQHPESKLTQEALSDNRDCDDPIFIDDRHGNTFLHVLAYMGYGKVVLPLSVSMDSFKTDLDFYGIHYNDDDIIDCDTLHKQIEEIRAEVTSLKIRENQLNFLKRLAELDSPIFTGDPFIDSNVLSVLS